MSRGTDRLLRSLKQFADLQYKLFTRRYGQQLIDIFDFPIKVVLSPFTLAFDIAGSAPRGFGVPEFISKLSYSAIFAVATLGTYDIALELGKKVLCQRNCGTCNGWQALQCTMCKGLGKVQYQVKNYTLKSGEKATAKSVADAIAENRAELVHLPSSMDLHLALPSKDCPSCDGSGVMRCPECKDKLQIRISADDIMVPPWQAYNIISKMDYPYEHIVHSMRDPSIAAFWLITMPEIVGGFTFDDEVKKKIWWQYKESMQYDQLRNVVAKRKPGWEYLQEELNLPLNASAWSEEDLKDPKKLYEMTVLLNAQREIADKILDAQWETKWRQEKLNEMLEEKVRPYIQNMENSVVPPPIVMQSPENQDGKRKNRRRRWWLF
ncbi:uncharacterized protein LOC127811986 isoform X2 [Diospyros lotus]|uniref:uncharacterized protein LOC127811986 isoform X2 n=1 Tax=Diospyros lotus TaxID=55363 RepID=UPI00225313A4|nr:uncharacterized protein LOC127811986 isoform X2 [Diospyros lotus]